MKANKEYGGAVLFVKKYGIDDAKQLVSMGDGVCEIDDGISFHTRYLKRLVESHELIKKDFESVEMAEYEYMVSASYNEPYWVRVKQAIADVESCQ